MSAISSQNDVQSRDTIQTFVFFDLETTGLIEGSNIPKITEMSLIASSRNSFLFNKNGTLPRVLHKLTIPLQPLRLIPLIVSQITGFYNDLLEHEKPFDNQAYELLNCFISRLHPPVCFVAHNGNRFDYPILLAELNRIGKTLSDDILCIDSLVAFRTLLGHNFNESDKYTASQINKEYLNLLNDGCDEALAKVVDSLSTSSTSVDMESMDAATGGKYEFDAKAMQKVNETTPTHQIKKQINKIARTSGKTIVKKRLPFTTRRLANFKLETVYEYLVGTPPLQSHCAEADCLSMLVCVVKIGDSFIRWADHNASPLVQYAIKR